MVNGSLFRDMMISAANSIENNKQILNDLNVFPVPDGDTGTNMSMTINSALKDLGEMKNPKVCEVSDTMASCLLRGARGNSGVILSLLFRGFARALKDKKTIGGKDIATAMKLGVDTAYGAVMKPTEGTILTVSRVSAEKASIFADSCDDPILVWEKLLEYAKETLEETPELLPTLKQAGVVDAGGKGFVFLLEGAYSVLKDGIIIDLAAPSAPSATIPFENQQTESAGTPFKSFDFSTITYMYCTEFMINKEEKKGRPKNIRKFKAFLNDIGDSIVVVDDDTLVKVHVHTNNPGLVLEEALQFGYLSSMKIENMKEQFEKMVAQSSAAIPEDIEKKDFAFVVVSAGAGLADAFKDLGADCIVEGGQTMNPSTEDILRAVLAVPSDVVFVLPNNKNIIMAAEQVAALTEKRVIVIPTKTIPQGISAMVAFASSVSTEENESNMRAAIELVKTGLITYAVRNSTFDGVKIKRGKTLALNESKLAFVEENPKTAAIKLVADLLDDSSSMVTIIFGNEVSEEEAEEVASKVKENAGSFVEVMILNGGQSVYYYILSVE